MDVAVEDQLSRLRTVVEKWVPYLESSNLIFAEARGAL